MPIVKSQPVERFRGGALYGPLLRFVWLLCRVMTVGLFHERSQSSWSSIWSYDSMLLFSGTHNVDRGNLDVLSDALRVSNVVNFLYFVGFS